MNITFLCSVTRYHESRESLCFHISFSILIKAVFKGMTCFEMRLARGFERRTIHVTCSDPIPSSPKQRMPECQHKSPAMTGRERKPQEYIWRCNAAMIYKHVIFLQIMCCGNFKGKEKPRTCFLILSRPSKIRAHMGRDGRRALMTVLLWIFILGCLQKEQ